jgi:hypothetical protein
MPLDYETGILQFIRENFPENLYSVDNFKPKELIWVYIRCIEEETGKFSWKFTRIR